MSVRAGLLLPSGVCARARMHRDTCFGVQRARVRRMAHRAWLRDDLCELGEESRHGRDGPRVPETQRDAPERRQQRQVMLHRRGRERPTAAPPSEATRTPRDPFVLSRGQLPVRPLPPAAGRASVARGLRSPGAAPQPCAQPRAAARRPPPALPQAPTPPPRCHASVWSRSGLEKEVERTGLPAGSQSLVAALRDRGGKG